MVSLLERLKAHAADPALLGAVRRGLGRAAVVAVFFPSIGCTESTPHDHSHPEPGPPLEACMMLPSVRAATRLASENARFEVELARLEPDAPSLGDNRWDIALRSADVDADAAPVEGAILSFSLWMPEHAHGSLKATVVEPAGEGHYEAEPLSFHMPGIWEITIDIESSQGDDRVVFNTCVVP